MIQVTREQKVIRISRYADRCSIWTLSTDCGSTYINSQGGESELSKDLSIGWFVKYIFEDYCYIILLMEKEIGRA